MSRLSRNKPNRIIELCVFAWPKIILKINLLVIFYFIFALIVQNNCFALKRALVIGIGDYPYVPRLNGPKADAQNIKKFLHDSLGFENKSIKMLIDEQATRKQILESIDEWLVNGTSSGDELMFYYSGHGFQAIDRNGDEEDNFDEAIVAYDAKVESKDYVSNLISDDEVSAIFDRLADRSVTMIIDSCHSGTLTRGLTSPESKQYEKTITPLVGSDAVFSKDIINSHRKESGFIESAPRRVVWTAVSAWQKALVDIESGHGSIFTNLFIKAIKDLEADKNHDRVVTRAETLSYVRNQSNLFCKRNQQHCRTGLTPTLEVPENLYIADVTKTNNTEANLGAISNADYIVGSLSPIEDKEIRITLLPEREQYKVGEEMIMQITSPVDGHLIVIDVSATGDVVQLFPNKYTLKENFSHQVKANQSLHIPSSDYDFNAFKVLPPSGSGKIVAIVAEDDVFPEFVSVIEGDFKQIGSPRAYTEEISSRLNDVWRADGVNRSVSWLMSTLDYTIVD